MFGLEGKVPPPLTVKDRTAISRPLSASSEPPAMVSVLSDYMSVPQGFMYGYGAVVKRENSLCDSSSDSESVDVERVESVLSPYQSTCCIT